jgi:hypothetical protein
MRVLSTVLILILGSHDASGDRSDWTHSTNGELSRTSPTDSTLVSRFIGCYILQIDRPPALELRLLPTPDISRWRAETLDRASNAKSAVEKWSWAPLDASRLHIWWSGIDSWMELDLGKTTSGWSGTGTLRTATEPHAATPLHLDVQRIACPSPAT